MIRVLIIEDEIALAKALRDSLLDKEFEPYIATNGKEGLEALHRYDPDVVLLDMVMPVMDGHQFLKKIKKLDKQYKIIVLSNNDSCDKYGKDHKVLLKNNVRLADLGKYMLCWLQILVS